MYGREVRGNLRNRKIQSCGLKGLWLSDSPLPSRLLRVVCTLDPMMSNKLGRPVFPGLYCSCIVAIPALLVTGTEAGAAAVLFPSIACSVLEVGW